jgi:hypothetical protein
MTELGPNARSLIGLARGEDDPDDAARERVREAFWTRVNSGQSTEVGHGTPAAVSRALALKPSTLLAVVAAAVGGGWAAYSQYTTAPSTAAPPSSSLVALASATSLAGRVEPEQPPLGEGQRAAAFNPSPGSSVSTPGATSARGASGPSSERAATPTRGSERASPPEAREKTAREPSRDRALPVEEKPQGSASFEVERSATDPRAPIAERATLTNEALLAEAQALREVQKLLRAGNSARALTRLTEQDREFANGQLGEARAAARAMGVCTSQSAEMRQKTLSAFAARWPRSILLSSVRSACQSGPSSVDDGAD